MVQYARPDSDISRGSSCDDGMGNETCWVNQSASTSNLYQSIDDSASDSDYIYAQQGMDAAGKTSKFGLSNVSDPSSSSNHKVIFRAKGETMAMSNPRMSVFLYQGASTQIAVSGESSAFIPGDSFAQYGFELSATEANNISDYTDLRLWFKTHDGSMMGDAGYVSVAWFECPDAGGGGGTVPEDPSNPDAFLMFLD